MKVINLKQHSSLSQSEIFKISTNIENFHKIMPNYFKSLEILEETDTEKIVTERIKFMGISLNLMTKHIIKKSSIHEIHLLGGFMRGTQFIETYVPNGNECDVFIEVRLQLNGFAKLFKIFEEIIITKMSLVLQEFITLSEEFHSLKQIS